MTMKKFPERPKLEAKKHLNGCIYEIDKEFEGIEKVPPENMKDTWKVNERGEIERVYISNKSYHRCYDSRDIYSFRHCCIRHRPAGNPFEADFF